MPRAALPVLLALTLTCGALAWQASGLPGQGGVPNAYWLVKPNVDIPAGKFQITDSSPATWSQNSGTGGAGMAMVFAVAAGFTWPALPDALVPLASVANGCGPEWFGAGSGPKEVRGLPVPFCIRFLGEREVTGVRVAFAVERFLKIIERGFFRKGNNSRHRS